MTLSRAQNRFMPSNINSIVLLETYVIFFYVESLFTNDLLVFANSVYLLVKSSSVYNFSNHRQFSRVFFHCEESNLNLIKDNLF